MDGIVSNSIEIRGMPEEEKEELKSLLTFDNPVYIAKKTYSKYYYLEPQYLYYFIDTGDVFTVPRGAYVIPFCRNLINKTVYRRIRERSEFTMKLRREQALAFNSFFKKNRTLDLCGMIQQKTGAGKTITALRIAHQICAGTLIVVHKDDLFYQWIEEINKVYQGKEKVGMIKGKDFSIGEYLTIATYQTLARLPKEDLSKLQRAFSVVICDECHRTPANTFSLINTFYARYRIGLTATPERSDGLSHVMGLYFGGYAFKSTGAENEDILPVTVKPVYVRSVINNDTNFKGGFSILDSKVVEEAKNEIIRCILKEYELGRSIVVFFKGLDTCRDFYGYLFGSGIPKDRIGLFCGLVSPKENRETLKNADSIKPFITISTYSKGMEGTNVKNWEVEILGSSIPNGRSIEQVVGRIRRRAENKINPVIVYDFRYPNVAMLRHHGAKRDNRYRHLGFTIEDY